MINAMLSDASEIKRNYVRKAASSTNFSEWSVRVYSSNTGKIGQTKERRQTYAGSGSEPYSTCGNILIYVGTWASKNQISAEDLEKVCFVGILC